MQIIKTDRYISSLERIMFFISKDSVARALEFESSLDDKVHLLVNYPYKCRQSIYFDNQNTRDLVFKGYVIPYFIDNNNLIILGITKYKKTLS